MSFKSGPVAIGTSDTDVFEMGVTREGACVLGIGNVNGSTRTVTVKFYEQQTGLTTTLTTGYSIAANTFTKFPIPLAMEAGDKIILAASNADSIVAVPTVTDSAAAPAAQGFTPRGEWSIAVNYARNDLVRIESAGTTYVSMVDDNFATEPNGTDPGAWMVFVADGAQGDPGTGDVESANNLSDLADIPTALNTLMAMDATPAADHSANGPTTNTFAAGESVTVIDLCYLHSDGEWHKTDADAAATAAGMLAISLESKTDGQEMKVATKGAYVRDDTWNWTPGATLYVGTSPGAIVATQPSGTDDVVRVVGFAVTADVIMFDPSPDYITHT